MPIGYKTNLFVFNEVLLCQIFWGMGKTMQIETLYNYWVPICIDSLLTIQTHTLGFTNIYFVSS